MNYNPNAGMRNRKWENCKDQATQASIHEGCPVQPLRSFRPSSADRNRESVVNRSAVTVYVTPPGFYCILPPVSVPALRFRSVLRV